MLAKAQVLATKLMPSVVLRVKITFSLLGEPMKPDIFSRAPS